MEGENVPKQLEYSGVTTSYTRKCDATKPNPVDTNKALRKVWFLDVQWSTCPIEVANEVKIMWRDYGLGNDRYILKLSVDDLLDTRDVPYLVQYIREHGIPDDEQVIIHWWW